ncbi:MAG: hypothetical protein P4L53_05865, partial [Candidatus Obscuribacterales bacterium]|nr:hypothetical protein [Candidatus Obscuribacterales bacterium]
VQINLNQFGITGTNTFLLGGGGSNGTGLIDATPVSGNYGEIYITNGASNSGVGNMTISSASAVKIPDGGGLAGGGYLALEAYGGTLTLPIGSISVPGAEAAIQLAAKEVDTVDGTNLSANYTAGGDYHYVDIYADTFKYAGNVVISANGSGASGNYGSVYMQGYTTTSPTQVNLIGTSGATLNMGADGDYTYAQVSGDNIAMSGGAVTMHSEGTTDHTVYITNSNTQTGTTDTVTISDGNFIADVSGGAGNVDIEAAAVNITSPAFTLIGDGNSSGNGDGGNLTLNAGSTAFGQNTLLTFSSNGSGTGNGGAISVSSGTDLTNIDTINSNGGCNSGNGGPITLNGNRVSFAQINGAGGGGDNTMCIAAASSTAKNLAPRVAGDGTGADLIINTAEDWAVDRLLGVDVHGEGAGNGGTITVTNAVTVDASLLRGGVLNATGGESGAGGKISIAKVQNYGFPPQILFLVNAGQSSPVTNPDGLLKLNEVTCGQWKIGLGNGNVNWPQAYWDCANPMLTPAQQPANDKIPASVATTLVNPPIINTAAIQTSLNASATNIFFFNAPGDWNSFFNNFNGRQADPSDGGITISVASANSTIVWSSVFNTSSAIVAKKPLSTNQVTNNIAHELGHAVDASRSSSLSGAYAGDIGKDETNIQNAGAPCSTNNSKPFDNVVDNKTNAAMCDPATGMLVANTSYNGLNDLQIAQTSSIGVFGDPNKASETFAEAFAYAFKFKSLNPFPWSDVFQTTAEGVFKNGYYACAVSRANNVLYNTAYSCP